MSKTFLLFLLLITINLLGFPENQNPHGMNRTYPKINIEVKIVNGTYNEKFTAPIYPAISAITDSFVIRTFNPDNEETPFKFKRVKIYPSAKYYELVVSYKGVNYFKKFTKEEITKLKTLEFKVYEQGNIKDNIKIKQLDYVIENNQFRKELFITEDIIVENKGNFTYSPILPQKERFKIQLPKGVKSIFPRFNLSKDNYIIEDGYLTMNTFLKPGDNFFTFAYLVDVDQYPFILRTKAQNNITELRVIMPNSRTRVKTNFISRLSIRELEKGPIKIGVKKNIMKNKDLKLTILGKPNFKKGMIVSNIKRYNKVKSFEHYIVIGSLILLILGIFFISIFVRKEEKNV